MAASSSPEMPEKRGEERITGKKSFIITSFVENSTDILILLYYNPVEKHKEAFFL